MPQVKQLKIFQILLEKKRYLFLALFIFLSIQIYWSYLGKNSLRFMKPTPESWTFEHIKQRNFKESEKFSWVGSSVDDVSDWKHIFNPETSDYDIHKEKSSYDHVPGTNSTGNSILSLSTRLPDNEKLSLKADGSVVGLLIDETSNQATPGLLNVAIGSGLTTAKVLDLKESNLHDKMQLFKSFLPSFCKSVSIPKTGESHFNFHFYFAYDYTDKVLDGLVRDGSFYRIFRATVDQHCPKLLPTYLHFVQCDHTHRPAWAQNDAMIEAYLDNVDYFYRINDDTVMKSNNWIEIFVDVLRKYDPPNVGVVGPSHSGGNMAILTYDFVHKTHVDIFGFYYPRLFTDWWGDDWVTKVYLPGRMTKVKDIFLQHTLALGQRYSVKDWGVAKKLQRQLERDRITLSRYVRLVKKISKQKISPDPSRVISMSLYGSNPRHTWGAIRNAQLARVLFPGWKIRFYVSRQSLNSSSSGDKNVDLHDHTLNVTSTKVSRRLLKRLQLLGAEIKLVNDHVMSHVQPIDWRNLAIMDDKVEWVIARNVDSRLTESEAHGVERWIENFRGRLNIDTETLSLASIADFLSSFVGIYKSDSKKPAVLHVVRDFPESIREPFPSGMWGGNARLLRLLLDDSLHSIIRENESPGIDAGSSAKIQQKFKSLNISNPYLNPGVEELVRVWAKVTDQNKLEADRSTKLLGHLASRLTLEHLDHITCLQEDDPSFQHSFAGQIFNEHELPFVDNKVTDVEPVFEDMERVAPSLLCKTIDSIVLKPSTDSPTTTTTKTTSTTTTTTTTSLPSSSMTTKATKHMPN